MDKYTKFILTVIAVALIGILFKGAIITPAEANSSLGRLNKIITIVQENNNILRTLYNR
jgi:hypothetical protein|tara:strand:+ start:274 stop:450 length:177 start_codon:yes stop_codon:yes gene_type:complete